MICGRPRIASFKRKNPSASGYLDTGQPNAATRSPQSVSSSSGGSSETLLQRTYALRHLLDKFAVHSVACLGWVRMKMELWCSDGGRRVRRSASKGVLQFRSGMFAMLAAFLTLIAFTHLGSAQTNNPFPVRQRPSTHAAPRPGAAAQTPATTPAAPFTTSPPVVTPAATAAPADAQPAPAATSQVAQSPATSGVTPVVEPSPANAAASGASPPTSLAAPPPGENLDQHRGAAAGPLAVGNVPPCGPHR
jgi:hypothetical protein